MSSLTARRTCVPAFLNTINVHKLIILYLYCTVCQRISEKNLYKLCVEVDFLFSQKHDNSTKDIVTTVSEGFSVSLFRRPITESESGS